MLTSTAQADVRQFYRYFLIIHRATEMLMDGETKSTNHAYVKLCVTPSK